MHAEFLEDEIPYFDLCIMDAFAQIRKGIPKSEACKSNKITEQEYDDNIERVMY